MTELYLKTKREIENLDKIGFDKNNWNWYLTNGVNKRINELKPSEGYIIKQLVHSKRAKALLAGCNI